MMIKIYADCFKGAEFIKALNLFLKEGFIGWEAVFMSPAGSLDRFSSLGIPWVFSGFSLGEVAGSREDSIRSMVRAIGDVSDLVSSCCDENASGNTGTFQEGRIKLNTGNRSIPTKATLHMIWRVAEEPRCSMRVIRTTKSIMSEHFQVMSNKKEKMWIGLLAIH